MTAKGIRVPYEEALNLAGTGYTRYTIYVSLLCASIIVGMTFEIFSVSYLVPASACEFHTTSAEQGLIAAMPLIGTLTTSHFWGFLADTKGRKKILTISMTLSFITGTAAAFSPNWIVFGVFKLLSSASVSGAFALSVAFLSECTPASTRSSLVLLTTSVHLVCMGFMAVIAIPVLPLPFSFYMPKLGIFFNSWRVLDLICALPSAVSAIGCLCVYESPKFLASVGKEQEAMKVLQGMYSINTGKSPNDYKVDSIDLNEDHSSSVGKGFWASVAAQTLPMLRPPLLKYTILLAALYVISYICVNAFFVWLPYILDAFMVSVVAGETGLTICGMIRHSANFSVVQEVQTCALNSEAMTLVFVIALVLAAGNIFMSVAVNWIGRKQLFIGIQMVAGVAGLVLNFIPYWILSAILFMVFLSGIFNFGFLNTFSVDIFPTYVKAMAVCLTLMIGRGSAIVGINVLKNLLDNNCEAAFYIFGAIAVCGGLVGFLLPSTKKFEEQKSSFAAA